MKTITNAVLFLLILSVQSGAQVTSPRAVTGSGGGEASGGGYETRAIIAQTAVSSASGGGFEHEAGFFVTLPIIASVGDDTGVLPYHFSLRQNYPNPFNPSTLIEYQLSSTSRVTVTIYNVLGQSVHRLVDAVQPAGVYRVNWFGLDDQNRPLASGVYFYRIQAGEAISTKKMLMLK